MDSDHLDTLVRNALAEHDPARQRHLRQLAVVAALPLADGTARRFRGRGVDADDLEQVARLALVDAVHRFPGNSQARFGAYAVATMSGAIRRHFRDHAWSVRPPRALQELQAQIAPTEATLQQRLGRNVTEEEVAQAIGVPLADLAAARLLHGAYYAINIDMGGGDSTGGGDDPVGSWERHEALRAAVAGLSTREQEILRLRFVEDLPQARIADHIGTSQVQISRILAGILPKLRRQLQHVI
ncbi:MAG TPA: sigma-70 family RNA polymerase sigma factor [Tetrasphaera sp.]|uniref:sigma-70 family RNA polymerase sigma factor n=1 Tax=Nostocoides sp. TaxID=1917966 RepID=UPI002D0B2208|nr:sigma-70 family RNA polymerase sigma factor [Tetrasphaera sp.]HNQ06067.1 sigma-70 family RNA polymerase sigma factor [Tetrasphaera sp.]